MFLFHMRIFFFDPLRLNFMKLRSTPIMKVKSKETLPKIYLLTFDCDVGLSIGKLAIENYFAKTIVFHIKPVQISSLWYHYFAIVAHSRNST